MSNTDGLAKYSVLDFDLPFMINLPDGPYPVSIDDYQATVYLKRNRSPPDMPGTPKNVKFPPDSYVKGDKLGRFNYTKIRIIFNHAVFIKPGILFQDVLLEKSVEIINRILDVCTAIKGDNYVRINGSDIFSHKLTYLNPEGKEVPGGALAIGGETVVGMGGAYDPTQQQIEEIKSVLAGNAKLPLWQSLLFDASDNHFYRNFRTAVVEAGTAFEVFVYHFIRKGYLRVGKTEPEIENILDAGLKNLLTDHIRILTGINLQGTNEYNNWNTNSYLKRNDIVHRGDSASDFESKMAVTVVADTIRYITSLNYVI